jgi:hypothetical protein
MKEAAATTTKNDDTAEGGTQRPLATRELTMIRPTGSRHREITNETVGVGSSLGDVIGRHTNSHNLWIQGTNQNIEEEECERGHQRNTANHLIESKACK